MIENEKKLSGETGNQPITAEDNTAFLQKLNDQIVSRFTGF